MTRICLLITALVLTALSAPAQVSPRDSLLAQWADRPMRPIEGLWQFAPADAVVGVVEVSAGRYEMVLLDSPDSSMLPGTVIGHLSATTDPLTFDAELRTHKANSRPGTLTGRTTALVVLDSDGTRWTLKPYRQGVKFDVFGLLPFAYRRTLRKVDSRPDAIDGCRRVWPPIPDYPVHL